MSEGQEAQYLYLTTTGRKSGSPHRIEIWFVQHGPGYYLVSELLDRADIQHPVRQEPAVSFQVDGQVFAGKGREVDPAREPELAAAVRKRMDAKYDWSEGLIVELRPD